MDTSVRCTPGSLGPTISPIVDVLREPVARALRGYIYLTYPHRVPTFRRGTWLRCMAPDMEVRVRFPVMELPCSTLTGYGPSAYDAGL
jgi:hypothetical protein